MKRASLMCTAPILLWAACARGEGDRREQPRALARPGAVGCVGQNEPPTFTTAAVAARGKVECIEGGNLRFAM
jgi:hypothetical protein